MATNKDFVVKNGLQVGANTSIVGAITTVDSIQFDLTANTDPYAEGQLAWNADHGTLTLGIDGSDVDLHIGEDTIIKVKAAVTITKGDVVYASGAVGNSGNIEVTPFIANATIEAKRVIGVAAQNIATGNFGYVISQGEIRGIDASGGLTTGAQTWSDGDILYASPDYAGELSNVEPTAPNQDIAIAFVVSNNGSNGIIQVRASQLGYNLGELHDVNVSSVANNQILTYDAVNSRWNNSDDLTLPGDLTVAGNFTVSGNTTYINTNDLSVEDLNIVIASGAADSAAADGAGITVDGANKSLTWVHADSRFYFNSGLGVGGNTNIDGNLDVSASSTEARSVQIGHGRSGDGISYLDLVGDTTYSDYGLRLQREGTANGKSALLHRGTGNLEIRNLESSTIRFKTADTDRMQIKGGGDITVYDTSGTVHTFWDASEGTINGAFGNTQVQVASSYPYTPYEGNIWFDNLNLKLKVYDGSNWQDAVPASGGGGGGSSAIDATATFAKYTFEMTSAGTTVSGASDLFTTAGNFVVGRKYEIKTVGNTDFTLIGAASNTVGVSFTATGAGSGTGDAFDVLQYDTSGIENVEVYVNGVKQVEGSSYDYTATTGISVGFTTTLAIGDIVDIQVYELLTNDAYVPKAGGSFEGTVDFSNTAISQTFTNASLAHGMTLIADTDQFLKVTREAAGGNGGVRFSALTDGSTAFNLSAYSTSPSTDGNNAVIRLRAAKSNGSTSETALADDEDVLTIGNTGTELVTVKGNGNVGIGTSNPGDKLVVKGDGARMTVESSTVEVAMLGRRGSTSPNTNRGYLRLRYDGVTADGIVLDTGGPSWLGLGGNVGINTASPDAGLDIFKGASQHTSSKATARIYHYNYPDDNTTNVPALDIRVGNTDSDMKHHGNVQLRSLFTGSGYTSPHLQFHSNANSSNDKGIVGMYVTSGNTPAFTVYTDLIGSSESNVDIVPDTLMQLDKNVLDLRFSGATDNAWNNITTFAPRLGDTPAESQVRIQSYPSTTSVPARRAGVQAMSVAGATIPLVLQKDGNDVRVGDGDVASWEGATSTARLSVDQTDQYRGAQIVSDTTSNYAASLHLDRAKGSGTATASGDNLGSIVFNGTNSSGVRRQSAVITSVATATAGSYQPSQLEFVTVYNGGNSKVIQSPFGHLYPNGSSQDLGTSNNPWQNIYTQDLVLSNESRETGNDVDGTKGNWTVQEGEDHLYLINNKNGKKYRFALEEIE